MHLGVPDIGLVSVTELAEITSAIADAVSLPIIVDADTGFGNPVNVVRTVKLLVPEGFAIRDSVLYPDERFLRPDIEASPVTGRR